jgi:5,10-methylenetetrahydromethanopterin reductase
MIKLAARHADWITLSVGADPDRVRWGIDVAREELARCGRRPDDVRFSVFVCVCVHSEIDQARELVSDMVSTLARFNGMHGRPSGPWTPGDAEVINRIATSYDMTRHSQRDRLAPGILTPEFLDRFAILGPAANCVTRLEQLRALGVHRVVIASMPRAGNPAPVRQADAAFFSEVAPALRP